MDDLAAIAPNISLGLLYSFARSRDIPVEILDSEARGISPDALVDQLLEKSPQLVGIIASGANPSASTMSMVGVIEFFRKLKEKAGKKPFFTFVWGPHPTVLPERTLRETGADFVVRGEGYETIVQLWKAMAAGSRLDDIPGLCYLADGKYRATPPPQLVDVNTLPMVDWNVMRPDSYRAHNWHCFGSDLGRRSPYAIVWTSMGCSYPCEFCCINNDSLVRTPLCGGCLIASANAA